MVSFDDKQERGQFRWQEEPLLRRFKQQLFCTPLITRFTHETVAYRIVSPTCSADLSSLGYYWISGRNLQRQLLDLVNVVGQETGWFWNAIIEDIKREWAW